MNQESVAGLNCFDQSRARRSDYRHARSHRFQCYAADRFFPPRIRVKHSVVIGQFPQKFSLRQRLTQGNAVQLLHGAIDLLQSLLLRIVGKVEIRACENVERSVWDALAQTRPNLGEERKAAIRRTRVDEARLGAFAWHWCEPIKVKTFWNDDDFLRLHQGQIAQPRLPLPFPFKHNRVDIAQCVDVM